MQNMNLIIKRLSFLLAVVSLAQEMMSDRLDFLLGMSRIPDKTDWNKGFINSTPYCILMYVYPFFSALFLQFS